MSELVQRYGANLFDTIVDSFSFCVMGMQGGEGLLRTTARNSETKDGEWSNFVVGEHALVEFVVCRLPGCHSRNCGVCGGERVHI